MALHCAYRYKSGSDDYLLFKERYNNFLKIKHIYIRDHCYEAEM